jgi:hypothetical protein
MSKAMLWLSSIWWIWFKAQFQSNLQLSHAIA